MFEKKHQPLAHRHVFIKRSARHVMLGVTIIAICLFIGVAGYHYVDGVPWIDSLHNASMILGGMGPVVEIKSVAGKIFSSAYALFCGVMFITTIGIILAPAVHRFFHKLHLDDNDPS